MSPRLPDAVEHWSIARLRPYSDSGEIVFEPFTGSSTCVVAGQRTARIVRAIELAPEYADVTLLRWKHLFPEVPATLDGRPFDDVARGT